MKGRARSSPCLGVDSSSPLEGEAWISGAHTAAAGLPAGRLTPHSTPFSGVRTVVTVLAFSGVAFLYNLYGVCELVHKLSGAPA